MEYSVTKTPAFRLLNAGVFYYFIFTLFYYYNFLNLVLVDS